MNSNWQLITFYSFILIWAVFFAQEKIERGQLCCPPHVCEHSLLTESGVCQDCFSLVQVLTFHSMENEEKAAKWKTNKTKQDKIAVCTQ